MNLFIRLKLLSAVRQQAGTEKQPSEQSETGTKGGKILLVLALTFAMLVGGMFAWVLIKSGGQSPF